MALFHFEYAGSTWQVLAGMFCYWNNTVKQRCITILAVTEMLIVDHTFCYPVITDFDWENLLKFDKFKLLQSYIW